MWLPFGGIREANERVCVCMYAGESEALGNLIRKLVTGGGIELVFVPARTLRVAS